MHGSAFGILSSVSGKKPGASARREQRKNDDSFEEFHYGIVGFVD